MKKKTVLIVDDEPNILKMLESIFADKGVNTILKESGVDALKVLYSSKYHVDLLLTDISMTDMDGYELYSNAKDIDPDLPIVMMTGFGYDPNHAVVKSKKDGLEDVVYKDDKFLDKLFETVNKYLN